MNVTRLRLANFKRFSDLTVDLSSCAANFKRLRTNDGITRSSLVVLPRGTR
jgi:hypothetical protein